MKSFSLIVALSALLLVSCASTPPAPPAPPLPAVRVKEMQDSISSGSFLQALQEISWLRREKPGEVSAADLDSLESKALDALSASFTKAINDKKYEDALRLLDSATALGKTTLTGNWTERALLDQLASAEQADGNDVLSLMTAALHLPS